MRRTQFLRLTLQKAIQEIGVIFLQTATRKQKEMQWKPWKRLLYV